MRPVVAIAALLALAGCDFILGPSPLNDRPVIRRIGDQVTANAQNQPVQERVYFTIPAGDSATYALEIEEPEGEALTIGVGPLPRGWSYDPVARTLTARPDEAQRGLTFLVYIAAEDAHDPPAYDVRSAEFSVY